jgi:polar amino acid transport system substrate-binding protein
MMTLTEGNQGEDVVYRLAHVDHFPPFAFTREAKSVGLAIELLDRALATVNMAAVYIPDNLDKVQDLVQGDQADGIAVFAVNPERRKTYEFSEPILITGGGLFAKISGPHVFDLEAYSGKSVCTPLKGPLTGFIRTGFPKVKLLTVKDYPDALETVLQGKADAAALNFHVGIKLVSEQFPGEFAIPEKSFLRTPLAVAAIKGEKTFMLNCINDGLRKLKKESTYDQIIKKWMGTS